MKRVLVITPNFYPEKTGIGVSATDCARFIRELGNDVTVITAMPYYPEWEIHENYKGKLFVCEEIEGIKVKRLWIYVPKKIVTWTRIAHELSFAALLFVKALFQPCDLILCISPPLSAAGIATLLSVLKRKPLWSFVQDIQPDAAICLGMLRNKLLIRFSKWLERKLYQVSEKVLVLSEGMRSNILAKDVPRAKLEVVPISIEVGDLAAAQSSTPGESVFRAEFGLEDKFVVLYSGNIGVKQNPEIIVECAKALADHPDIFFAIVGEGALRSRIEQAIAESSLTNIGLYPLRERRLLGDMLCSADILLAPQRKEVLDIVMPSKLIAYLTSGKPVIASADSESEVARELRKHQAGCVCLPENVPALVEEILRLKREPQLAAALGAAGYRYAALTFDHDVVKEKCYRPLFGSVEDKPDPAAADTLFDSQQTAPAQALPDQPPA